MVSTASNRKNDSDFHYLGQSGMQAILLGLHRHRTAVSQQTAISADHSARGNHFTSGKSPSLYCPSLQTPQDQGIVSNERDRLLHREGLKPAIERNPRTSAGLQADRDGWGGRRHQRLLHHQGIS